MKHEGSSIEVTTKLKSIDSVVFHVYSLWSAAPAIPKDSTAQLNGTFSEDIFDSVLKTDPYDVLFSDLSHGDFENKMLSDYTLNEMGEVNDIGEFLSI